MRLLPRSWDGNVDEPSRSSLTSIRDDRGILVAAEFDQIPFAVKRVFTIRGPESGATRGHHPAPCDQLVVSTGDGQVLVRLGGTPTPIVLGSAGDAVLVPKGTWIEYDLADDQSSVLVLAAERYAESRLTP